MIRILNRNDTKEVANQVLRNAVVTTKNHLRYHSTNMTPSYQQNIKMKQPNPQISWKIKGICKSYNPTSKSCNICLTENLEILDKPDKKRVELKIRNHLPVSSKE